MKTVLKVTLACAAVAAMTSGCVNSYGTASLKPSATLEAGYPERSTEPKAATAALRASAPATIPAPKRAGPTAPSGEKVRYLGRAPHICTPSGFGRTSTCFARS